MNNKDDKNLRVFDFRQHQVRVIKLEGEPWFVATDVCRALGLANASMAIDSIPESEKRPVLREGFSAIRTDEGRKQPNSNPLILVVNEPGLYRLIFKSRKKEAEEFKTWVCTEVLPRIRKTGQYAAPGIDPFMLMLQQILECLGELLTKFNQPPAQPPFGYPSSTYGQPYGYGCQPPQAPIGSTNFNHWHMPPLPAPPQPPPIPRYDKLSMTEISRELGIPGVDNYVVRGWICALGLVEETANGLLPTERGQQYACWREDKNPDGTPRKWLLWRPAIIGLLREYYASGCGR